MNYFDINTGTVSSISTWNMQNEVTEKKFPIYNFRGMYLGYVENGAFVKMTGLELI